MHEQEHFSECWQQLDPALAGTREFVDGNYPSCSGVTDSTLKRDSYANTLPNGNTNMVFKYRHFVHIS